MRRLLVNTRRLDICLFNDNIVFCGDIHAKKKKTLGPASWHVECWKSGNHFYTRLNSTRACVGLKRPPGRIPHETRIGIRAELTKINWYWKRRGQFVHSIRANSGLWTRNWEQDTGTTEHNFQRKFNSLQRLCKDSEGTRVKKPDLTYVYLTFEFCSN